MKTVFLHIFTLIILLTASAFSQNPADSRTMDSHHLAPAIGKSGENPTASDSAQKDLNELNFRSANGFNSYLSRYALDHDYAVRGIDNYAALQPGVIRQDNLIYMFGSNFYQTGYYLNGIYVNISYTGRSGIYIIPEAMEGLCVGSLPFTSEFGGATGGVIDARMRTGGNSLRAYILHRTDAFAGEGRKFLNTYSYGYQSTVAMFSGPLFTPHIRFFAAGEINPVRDRARRFVEGFTMDNLVAEHSETSTYDTVSIHYPGGNTSANRQERTAFNGNLVYDFGPVSGSFDFTYLKNRDQLNETPILSYFNNRKAYNNAHSHFLNGSINYAFNTKGRVNLRYSTYHSFIQREDELFGSDYLLWYDSTANAAKGIQFPGRYSAPPVLRINGMNFQAPGAPYQDEFFKREENFSEIAGNLYYNFSNLLNTQIGIIDRRCLERIYAIRPSAIGIYSSYPGANKPQGIPWYAWERAAFALYDGYDAYGDETSGNGLEGPPHPRVTALYVQEKANVGIAQLQAGLRYESIDPGSWTLRDLANLPIIDPQTGKIPEDAWLKEQASKRLLPRMELLAEPYSFLSLNAGYGKYLQIPAKFPTAAIPIYGTHGPGNVNSFYGYDGIIESSQKEVGVFLHDNRFGKLNMQYMWRSAKYLDSSLPTRNHIFSSVFSSVRSHGFQTAFHYTYTNSEIKVESPDGTVVAKVMMPYIQKHRGTFLLDYVYESRKKKSIWDNTGVSLVYSFNSGHYFNKVDFSTFGQSDPYLMGVTMNLDPRVAHVEGVSTTPWYHNFDVKLYKFVQLSSALELRLSLNIINLFNRKNMINVYSLSGTASDDGFIHDPRLDTYKDYYGGDTFVTLYENVNLKNGEAYRDPNQGLGRDLWGTPRQILLEFQLGFH